MWRHRFVGIASTLAVIVLTACGGGGTSNMTPASQPAGPIGQSASRLQTTAAPDQQVRSIYARASIKRGAPKDPLANWVFLEPLAATDAAVFSVPPWVKKCASIDPIFRGLWYLSLSNFTDPLAQISLPSCTIPSTTSSDVAGAYHNDSILPVGNGNIYIVEIDVGFISLTTTPIAGPALGAGSTFLFGTDESSLMIQKFHLYAFFVAEYTGKGQPATVSI